MRAFTIAAVLILAVAAAIPAGAADSVPALIEELGLVPLRGATPVPFALENLAGGRTSLLAHRGSVVLVYLWTTW